MAHVFGVRQFGSFALYGLYLIIHYYGSEWINFVLKWYFVATGVGSSWAVSVTRSSLIWCLLVEFQTLRSLVHFMVGKTRWQSFKRYSLRFSKDKSNGR